MSNPNPVIHRQTQAERGTGGRQSLVLMAYRRRGGFITSEPPMDLADETSTFKIPLEDSNAIGNVITEVQSRHVDAEQKPITCGRKAGLITELADPNDANGDTIDLEIIINRAIPRLAFIEGTCLWVEKWYAIGLESFDKRAFTILSKDDPTHDRFYHWPVVVADDSERGYSFVEEEQARKEPPRVVAQPAAKPVAQPAAEVKEEPAAEVKEEPAVEAAGEETNEGEDGVSVAPKRQAAEKASKKAPKPKTPKK